MNGNRKILISVVAFVLVMAAVIGVLVFLNNNGKIEESTTVPQGGTVSEGGSSYIAESISSAPLTTSPAMNIGIDATEAEAISAFVSGTYYFSGTVYTNGTPSEIEIALSGSNFHTYIDMEDMTLGIMYLYDDVYLINDAEKTYISFSSIASMAGDNTEDLDMDELKEVAEMLDVSKYDFTTFEQYEKDYDGNEANCYKYYNDEVMLEFCFVAGELRQIDFGNVNGEVAVSCVADSFRTHIPSDMLTLSGLRQTTVFTFFGEDLMASFQ